MTDIVELVIADQRRIRYLWGTLHEAGRSGGADSRWVMGGAWERLAALIEAHADAEEEICHLPVFGSSPLGLERIETEAADLADIRELVEEARLAPIGAPAWWRAVDAAVSACLAHIDRQKQGVLAEFRRRASRAQRQRLGSRWSGYTTARLGDLLPTTHADGPACQLCELPIPGDHRHVLDAGLAAVLCSCQPCFEWFHHVSAGWR